MHLLAVDDQPDVIVAARNLDAARADLTRTRRDLDRADVRAPITGTVLTIHATPGQRPPAEGILEMGDTDQMMAEVEIYQDRIVQVQPGQPVELVSTAFGPDLSGQGQLYRADRRAAGVAVGRHGGQHGRSGDPGAGRTGRGLFGTGLALYQSRSDRAHRYARGAPAMRRLLQALFGRLPIGWLQLTHNRPRFAAALAGVAFANVLVFVQLGIMNSMATATLKPYGFFNADIMISAGDANSMTEGGNVARQWLLQALADPDVVTGSGLFIGNVSWQRAGKDA